MRCSSRRRRRHFTPTGSSWLNPVERWFAELINKQIRRGVHRSVQALEKDIRSWIANWNTDPKPYAWTKTADEILERLASYLNRIPDSEHQGLLRKWSCRTGRAPRQVPCQVRLWGPAAAGDCQLQSGDCAVSAQSAEAAARWPCRRGTTGAGRPPGAGTRHRHPVGRSPNRSVPTGPRRGRKGENRPAERPTPEPCVPGLRSPARLVAGPARVPTCFPGRPRRTRPGTRVPPVAERRPSRSAAGICHGSGAARASVSARTQVSICCANAPRTRASRVGKCRYSVATPTPARRATVAIGASIPCSAKTARAAARTRSRLRRASARSPSWAAIREDSTITASRFGSKRTIAST